MCSTLVAVNVQTRCLLRALTKPTAKRITHKMQTALLYLADSRPVVLLLCGKAALCDDDGKLNTNNLRSHACQGKNPEEQV